MQGLATSQGVSSEKSLHQAVGQNCYCVNVFSQLYIKYYSVALVRERTTPTERPPFVDEVSANFNILIMS
jgi:hypothetical protein